MSLTPGGRLGPFEITGAIGAGGMGEVFRARDTKLNRDVAVKVLPAAFADDPERLARFTREAQTLASLNHPNIGAIYGIEEAPAANGSGTPSRALVMELVEGDDLSTLIARGPIPVAETLPIARQIAEALEAAHEQGIVHRDLKPANIKIRADGTVKVLDFGLAKAMDPAGASSSNPNVSHSPTLTHQGTQAGLIIGTAAYMAPEQAKGKAVDKRADIWAFGVVLYEMLSGKRAFKGEDVSETLAAVLKDTLSMDTLPADLPASIPRLLRRCLEKDPKRRLGAMSDARFDLEEAAHPSDATSKGGARASLARSERGLWALLAGAASVAAIVVALRSPSDRDAAPVIARFGVPPPATGRFTSDPPRMAISPDGRYLVYAVTPQPGKPDQLWLRRLDSMEAAPVPGTESAADATAPQSPFWSPDARRLAYFVQSGTQAGRGSRLRIVDMIGGAVQTTCDFPSNNGSGSWNADGVILVSTQETKGVQRVSADGCAPKPVTTLDASRHEIAHLWPEFLPDGRHFIYQAQTRARGEWAIFVGSLDSAVRRKVVQAEYARFAAPNLLLYAKGGNLLAQTMDLETHELTGESVVVTAGLYSVSANGRSGFTVSNAGVLVFSSNPESQTTGDERQLTWLDRAGKPLHTVGPPVTSYLLRLSPDASRVALLEELSERAAAVTVGRSLWVADLSRSVKAPLTSDRPALSPTWSADGARLRFASRDENDEFTIAERVASGATPASVVYEEKGTSAVPLDESRDGTLLFTSVLQRAGLRSLQILSKPGGKATTYLSDGFDHPQASLSPDGRWVAFVSNESGTYEIIVQPFPDPSSGKWRISTNGGLAPRWRRDGRELFYLDAEQRLVAVSVTADRGFAPGKPTPLFSTLGLQSNLAGGAYWYDVAPDGQRFLFCLPAGGSALYASRDIPLTVTTHWTSLLTKK